MNSQRKGFTLVRLLTAIAVIGIQAARLRAIEAGLAHDDRQFYYKVPLD